MPLLGKNENKSTFHHIWACGLGGIEGVEY